MRVAFRFPIRIRSRFRKRADLPVARAFHFASNTPGEPPLAVVAAAPPTPGDTRKPAGKILPDMPRNPFDTAAALG